MAGDKRGKERMEGVGKTEGDGVNGSKKVNRGGGKGRNLLGSQRKKRQQIQGQREAQSTKTELIIEHPWKK